MRNVPINHAETIFEPFWDCGESYPEHWKYNLLSEYSIEYSKDAIADVKVSWNGIEINIQNQSDNDYSVAIGRDCNLNISGYNIFRMSSQIPNNMLVTIYCYIDGERRKILENIGTGDACEYDGTISGDVISRIEIYFSTIDNNPCVATLYWLGLACSSKQMELESMKSPYTSDWAGCFESNPIIKPSIGLFFDENGVGDLRNKINNEHFKSLFNIYKEKALEYLNIVPEEQVGKFLPENKLYASTRDKKYKDLLEPMETLAFVGIIENNIEMLRLSCRMALAVSHCEYWCDGIMGAFPGATWHHRSFTESDACRACATVLDLAGSLMTWHGRHIIYDAIIMKGLPRLEADFMTVEYIREMNQGIAFSGGRINALIALAKEYPRYKKRLEEAEQDFTDMIRNYIQPDGGTIEGPGYWQYTFWHAIPTMLVLAKYHNQTLAQYVPDYVIKSGEFMLAMMSTVCEGICSLPVNDNHGDPMIPIIPCFFSQATGDIRWKRLYARALKRMYLTPNKVLLMLADMLEDDGKPVVSAGFNSFSSVGQTAYITDCDDVGKINFHLCSGPTYFAHYHQDKGSFIIEAGGEVLAMDRGMCHYNYPYTDEMKKAGQHNLLMPENPNGLDFCQPPNAKGAKVIYSSYENGILNYASDNWGAWQDGIYKKNIRRVYSPDPHLYFIYDEVEYENPLRSSFRISTSFDIIDNQTICGSNNMLRIIPINWTVSEYWAGEYGFDSEINPVNQLRLYTDVSGFHHIITAIEIAPNGKGKLKIDDRVAHYGKLKFDIGLGLFCIKN